MIEAKDFVEELKENDLGIFVQVPCSILKPIINYMLDSGIRVETPVNEAVGMGIASGSYMSSGKISVLMLQNSGFCNTLNALTSLNQVYNIPVLYIITWRGYGGSGSDAPEHDITGENLLHYLKTFKIPYEVVSARYKQQISSIIEVIKKSERPAALILKKGVIKPYEMAIEDTNYPLSRFEAMRIIKKSIARNALYVSSNGFPSRDSFAAENTPDFYMMGSMGHALPIALGVCKHTNRKIIVLDGDGSVLMHVGAMASVGSSMPSNLIHIIIDNGIYDSTGGQPTLSQKTDFVQVALGFGYRHAVTVSNKDDLERAIEAITGKNGPHLIHVLVNRKQTATGKRISDIYTCPYVKRMFMKQFEVRDGI